MFALYFWLLFFQVCIQPLSKAFKMDCTNATVKAMPGLSFLHFQHNIFKKKQVNLAFQLFVNRVINGLKFYKNRQEASWGSIDAML